MKTVKAEQLNIGWAEADITPSEPVLIAGQFHARVSEGVADPITATVLAIEADANHFVLVSCDLVSISDYLRNSVRAKLQSEDGLDGLDPFMMILHATHTHTGPETRVPRGENHPPIDVGIDLPVLAIEDYVQFAAEKIAHAVLAAWASRSPGGIAFGQAYAVVGRNRRWVDRDGKSMMYGNTDVADFSHIEGYEDHSVNILATYSENESLSGLVVNVPCPAQVSELDFTLSADYWFETRGELRHRVGEGLPILAQCSAAGDQSPHLLFEKQSAERMRSLTGRTERQEIAHRISSGVVETLQSAGKAIQHQTILQHHAELIELPMTELTQKNALEASQEAELLRKRYQEERQKLESDPLLRNENHWYRTITSLYRRMRWFEGVVARYKQGEVSTLSKELHVIRLGEMAFATNPFEYYLDFGIHIKARSRAVQTFLVQLAGPGTYVPSERSTKGGGYGSIPASNPIGPRGGWKLAERTVEIIDRLWEEPDM